MRKVLSKLSYAVLIISFWECTKTMYQIVKGYIDYKPVYYIKDYVEIFITDRKVFYKHE